MVASSHGSPSSSSSAKYSHDHNHDLDTAHDILHKPTDWEFQNPSGSHTQATNGKQYDHDDTNNDKNMSSVAKHESPPQGEIHDINNDSDNDDDNDTSSTVTASIQHVLSTSSPSDDSETYTDADSTLTTPITATLQQLSLSQVDSKAKPIPSNPRTSIGEFQRKRSNTLSTLHSRPNDLSSLYSRSNLTSAPFRRPRSTSLVNHGSTTGMNSDALTINIMCDHQFNNNADTSCPTLGTSIHSDRSLSPTHSNNSNIERPSDAFRNRQSKRHQESLVSASSASIDQNQDSLQQLALKKEISNNLAHLKETAIDTYDWEFWATIIHQFDQVNQHQHQALRDHVCIGIPPSLRGMLWQVFSKVRHNSDILELEYRELLNGVSPHEKIIQRDLARTFPTHAFFQNGDGDGGGQAMLFNVIKAYSLYDPQVGYCQGLPFIVGCLLLHMPDEAAFCVLVKLMNDYGLRRQFTPKMELLHERLFQYESLLIKHLPEVHRHLDAQGVLPSMYASQWILTLFSTRAHLDLVFRVFDLVFTEGTSIILNVALALLKKNQTTILGLQFEGLLGFLGGDIFDAYQDNSTEFIKDVFNFHISQRDLTKLSKRYVNKAARAAKMQDNEDYLKAEHYELTQQATKLEKSLIRLEQEHEATAKQVIESKLAMATANDHNQKLRHDISQLEQQINKMDTLDQDMEEEVSRFSQENVDLERQNAQLESLLAEIKAILTDFKLKYAESENEYEQMKARLAQIRNSDS